MSEFNYNIETNRFTFKSTLTPLNLSKVTNLTLHHMAHATASADMVHKWHLDRGWLGIGYNYFITFDGRIIECRGLNLGAHASGFNSVSIGIGFQGDYQNVNTSMPDEQFNAGMWLIKKLMNDIPTINNINGHRDLMSTTCPGQNFPLVEFKGLKYRIKAPEIQNTIPTQTQNLYINMPTLRLGSRGEDVKVLQKVLYELGYTGVGIADGIFGNNTDISVKQFQSKNNLIADGIVGRNTWSALSNQKNAIATPIVEAEKVVDLNMYSNMPVLRLGSRGESVKILQLKLNELGFNVGFADGVFGNNTNTAVRQFQLANKLLSDGIVGQNTWKALAIAKPVYASKPLYQFIQYDKQTQIVKIKKSQLKKVDVLDSKTSRETVRSMYNRLNPKPTLMVNGGLFDTATGSTLSKFIDEGKIITNGFYTHFSMAIYGDKDIRFEEYDIWKKTGARDVIGGSPSLVVNGKISIDAKGLDSGFLNGRHPRLVLGEDSEHLYIMVVHGRRTILGHLGITIKALAELSLKVGMSNAINLDGGGSIMFLDSTGNPINNPLENRPVDNAVCFYLE